MHLYFNLFSDVCIQTTCLVLLTGCGIGGHANKVGAAPLFSLFSLFSVKC